VVFGILKKFEKIEKFPVMYLLFFTLLIPSSACVLLSYIENQAKLNIHKSLYTVLQVTQEALQRWTINQSEKIVMISRNAEIERMTQNLIENRNKYAVYKMQRNARASLDRSTRYFAVQNFYLIDKKGNNLVTKLDDELGNTNHIKFKRNTELMRIFDGEVVYIPPIMHPSHIANASAEAKSHPITFVGAPVRNDKGEVIAALIMGFDPKLHFSRITELGRMGYSGETYAFDGTGLLITTSRYTQNLRLLGMIGKDALAMLSIRISDPGINLFKQFDDAIPENNRKLTVMAKRAISGDIQPYYDAYRDYRGIPVFGAWLWNEALGIGLTTEIDASEAMRNYLIIRYITLLVLMIMLSLILCVVLLPLRFQAKEISIIEAHKKSIDKTVKERTQVLEMTNHKLKALSEMDPLTHLANRRAYNDVLMKEVASAKRTLKPISLLVIDVDFFKLFNDNYGHDQGDLTLQVIANLIKESLTRETDFAARYGGEEFVVILPATSEKGALTIAERIRMNIELKGIEHQYSLKSNVVTVSLGCVTLEGPNVQEKALFKKADHALYLAKKAGRNCVINYPNSGSLSR